MSFRDRYTKLIRRHLGRDPKRSDGLAEAALRKCERKLGVQLPESMRQYYLLAGRLDQLNRSHNLLFCLDELRVDDGHLWFMEENQGVVHWAIPTKQLPKPDPMVYQRVNEDGAKWYSQRLRFS